MVTEQDIQGLVARIAAEFRPQKIVLFGSHASGTSTDDSDVDLLVILPFTGPAYKKASAIRVTLPKTKAIDVVARTPEEFSERYAKGDAFLHEVMDTGRVLFAA